MWVLGRVRKFALSREFLILIGFTLLRHMRWFIVGFLCVFPLWGEKVIQCIANWPLDGESFNQFFRENGYESRVEVVPFERYAKRLKKEKGFVHRWLRKIGCDFPFSVPLDPDVDFLVFFNVTPEQCRRYDLSRLPKEKTVLFMWEPKTVLPRMYDPEVQACFSSVYTWDDNLIDGKKYVKFNYPVLIPQVHYSIPFNERKLCTFVSSDLDSKQQHELYSQRRAVVEYFEGAGERGFEFYGRRWNPEQHISYRGAPQDKLSVIKDYKFYICYENTSDVKGYITEKIFECFAAGVVPIYWGASNIDSYIPKGCFIDRRAFSGMEELHAFLLAMTEEEHALYLKKAKEFLMSQGAQAFTFQRLAEQMSDIR
ncbi:MAG: hypothetical protein RLZZ453_82 [Chlamydiota bacterium]|jgi:hypothetical protein